MYVCVYVCVYVCRFVGLRGVSRKGLDLMANPSAALILNIAVTNLLFACAMTASSVSVLVAAEGTLAAFSDNGW